MFGKLKNKLKDWTKSLSKKAEDVPEEDVQEIEEVKEEIAEAEEKAKEIEKEIVKEEREKEEKEVEKVEEKLKDAEKKAKKTEKEITKEEKEIVEEEEEKEEKIKKSKADKKAEKEERKRLAKEKKLAKKQEKQAKKEEEKSKKEEKKKEKDEIANEFNETITKDELENIVKKIQNLSLEEIDSYWHNCGWSDSEKGNNKSLPDWRLKKIKNKNSFAKESLTNLFLETKKQEILNNLEKAKEKIKQVEVPKKFDVATQKIEPDLEKVPEIVEEISKEVEKLPEIEEEKTITEIIEEKEETPEVKEEKEEPEKQVPSKEETKEKKSFFQKITSKVNKVKISEKDFDIYAEELEMLLIENNVALEVAEKMIKELREKIVGKEMLKKEVEGQIQEHFKDIIRDILVEPFSLVEKVKEFRKKNPTKPYVVLFCGINGTGKTTSIAKIAQEMKKNKLKPVLAAADTFRAASIEQIKKHAKKLDINVIAQDYGSDPAAVGFDAIKYAEKNKLDVVLIDTAGRMHTEKNLMAQIEKVAKVTKPNTKIFVGESITGNDIVEQVRSFDWAVQIDGIILSKADIDEKGGTALSVGYVTKKPILYLGTGQEYDEIEPFDKEKFIKKLGLDDEE